MKRLVVLLLSCVFLLVGFSACEPSNPDPGPVPGPVPAPYVEITGIELQATPIEMNVGEAYSLVPVLTPENARLKDLSWESTNEKVCTVSSDGTVTAVGPGKAAVRAFFGTLEATCGVFVNQVQRGYHLVWEENFDGPTINSNHWSFREDTGFGNGEKQYCTAREKNAFIENSCLVIQAYKEEYKGCHYTSARLESKNKVKCCYGKVEARISFPAGRGTWPAFWMMPNDSKYGGWPNSGEIDIVEHWGTDAEVVSHAVHTQEANGTKQHWSVKTHQPQVEDHFHVYGIEWVDNYQNGNDAILFYYDGNLMATAYQKSYKNSTWRDWPFNQDFYVILNLSIGGTLGGPVDDSIFNHPVQMKVDWVRMYELD